MTNDIKEHVRTCDTCQRTNRKFRKASAKLHPIPVRSEVWYQVGIDLVGPLTLTRNNNRLLCAIMPFTTEVDLYSTVCSSNLFYHAQIKLHLNIAINSI